MPVKTSQIIHIQPEAAAKPVLGEPCNGCGVCCLSEPCPLGMLLSRRRSGVCMALHWNDAVHQYRCGALTDAALVLRQALPRGLGWLAPVAAPLLRQFGRRWIAAGQGCDSSLEVQVQAGAESDRQSLP